MVDLTSFSALSFDVYGTLIDWEAGIANVLKGWAERHQSDLDDEQLLLAYADNEAAVEREYPGLAYAEVLQAAFRRTAKDLNLPVTDEEVQELGRSVPNWPAFEDTHEALSRLKKHYKLIILSNVHQQGVDGSIKRMAVDFDQVNTAEQIGSYKPNPRNFEVLLERLGDLDLEKQQLLHVAQSLFHDHVPGKNAGLDTIWINRRYNRPGWGATPDPQVGVTPDAEYKSLADFADAVDDAFADKA
ncbi:haloacid dehalogenase type II [Pseudoclavibacter terrae]|uniref:Haloacid dehalogenase type II n=1 Tax=Pseudoclavibacter terrae TaxID=1530195 RepID=A0A7J5AXP7_9MICO|nr:haloacid dehalogenase type II [Pseudoclavibacter terrae]KAB1636104.1 haloacid dehalogenase type II [Pseudoclavibacter terrae]